MAGPWITAALLMCGAVAGFMNVPASAPFRLLQQSRLKQPLLRQPAPVVATTAAAAAASSVSSLDSADTAVMRTKSNDKDNTSPTTTATVHFIIPSGEAQSDFKTKPFGDPVTWQEALGHIQEKLRWEPINTPDEPALANIRMEVLTMAEAVSRGAGGRISDAQVVVLVDLPSADVDSDAGRGLTSFCRQAAAVVNFGCASGPLYSTIERYGDYEPASPLGGILAVWDKLTKSRRFKDRAVKDAATDLWQRKSTGDLLFMILVLLDYFSDISIKSVQSVTSSETTSFNQLYCMCTKCTKQIAACLQNEQCRKALDCLENCRGNDQVCSYRCIVSYETEEFEQFARCILQKHNCMGNTATAPVFPNPPPLATFRGAPLTHEVAEAIFEGWLQPRAGESNLLVPSAGVGTTPTPLRPWSWKVVCGQVLGYPSRRVSSSVASLPLA